MADGNQVGSGIVEKVIYDDDILKKFIFATIFWGAAAFLVGLLAALQVAFWKSNLNLEWLTFGRIRPLHTNAAIFAFGGNIIFAGIYHSTQRLLKTRLYSDILGRIHFWGWQLIIVGALITLPLGYSQSKEYAELEGDCVNCYKCVVVCPTGIDIRRGMQMECVGCTACIDACDEVMEKIEKPRASSGTLRATA